MKKINKEWICKNMDDKGFPKIVTDLFNQKKKKTKQRKTYKNIEGRRK